MDWNTIRKKTIRAKESMMQSLGKADKTYDNDFAEVKNVFLDQQKNGYHLRDSLRNYLVSVRAANEALRKLHNSMYVMYEPEVGRADQLKYLTQDSESVWDQYINRNEKVFQNVNNYCAPFPTLRNKIAKRNRKLIDYDIARHSIDSLKNNPKRTDDSVRKGTEQFEKSRDTYESLNEQVMNEIPELHDSRLPFALENFRYFFDDASKFHEQASKVNQEIAELVGQDHEKFKANPPPPRPLYVRHKSTDYKSPIQPDADYYTPINHFQHSVNFSDGSEIKQHSLRASEGNLVEGAAYHPQEYPEQRFKVTHKYIPTEDHELPLELGDVVEIVRDDFSLPNGWAHGFAEKSGQRGVFPINFTKRIH